MRSSDRLDDREAEAGPATAARGIPTAEAVERTVAKVPESDALVANMQRDPTGERLRRDLDPPGAMADRVLDQVRQRLFDAQAIGPERQARRRSHFEGAVGRAHPRLEPVRNRLKQRADVDHLGRQGQAVFA